MRGSGEILRFRGVEKTIGRLKALNGLDLVVSSGEFVALVGPTASGKTAVLRLATGLDVPDQGSVTFASADAANRYGIGAAIPDIVMEPGRTLLANLRSAADLQGLRRGYANHRIGSLLDRLGLRDRAGDRIRSLADADRRRAEIVRALLHRPTLLMLGNITEGLTPSIASQLLDEVLSIRAEEGIAILWATTKANEAAGSDRLIVLRRGTVVFSGPPADLLAQHPGKDLVGAVQLLTRDSAASAAEGA
jgi:ABC-2 type transport system ATP-binding protein